MSSRSSSSSRNTILHLQQRDDNGSPITPINNREGATMTPSSKNCDTKMSPSIRQRRGRRNVTDPAFRPLSIFTKSMLVPFNHNFDKAFDVLKSDSPDRLATAQSLLSSDIDTDNPPTQDKDDRFLNEVPIQPQELQSATSTTTGKLENQENKTNDKRSTTPPMQGLRSVMTRQVFLGESDMDLMTALQTTSPEKDSDPRISGDFQTLCELPAPDPSQHPAFAKLPFDVKTESPLLLTTTSADEIRAQYAGKQHVNNKTTNAGGDVIERKRNLFSFSSATPSSIRSRNAFGSPEDYPLATCSTFATTASSQSSFKHRSPTTADSSKPRESLNNERNGGVRKLSDMFRRKESMEKSSPNSPAWSPRVSMDTPNTDRHDLESYLRRTTFTPSFDFDPHSAYPRHPNTGRGWKSRNLKCTTCLNVDCAVCHRVCCAYRAAVLALENHNLDSPGRPIALQRILEITNLFPYGKEAPTFLQCTTGATIDEMGCGKIVCPDCCSICPDDSCADTICRRCKPGMWEDCEWHANGVLEFKVGCRESGMS